MDKFNFTDEEFITCVNQICQLDELEGDETALLTSMDQRLEVDKLDSLSIAIFFIWVSDLFGISSTKVEEFVHRNDFTIQAIKDFISIEATRTYSYAKAEEYIKRCS
jgi:hypothetical protein